MSKVVEYKRRWREWGVKKKRVGMDQERGRRVNTKKSVRGDE